MCVFLIPIERDVEKFLWLVHKMSFRRGMSLRFERLLMADEILKSAGRQISKACLRRRQI